MKKSNVICLALILIIGMVANAQTAFKKSLKGISRIEIESNASIAIKKGTTDQLILKEGCYHCTDSEETESTWEDEDGSIDEKAKGLTAIYAGGDDNTGLGMYMEIDGEVLRISDLKSFYNRKGLTLMVPSSIAIKLNTGNLGSVIIEDLTNELEINTVVGYIKLNNVTGPVTAHSSTGNIDAIFSRVDQSAPISITSSTGMIDVSLPSNTKASVDLGSTMGSVFTNFDLIKPREDGLKAVGGQKSITGNINNGGVKIALKASVGNIYLRKK